MIAPRRSGLAARTALRLYPPAWRARHQAEVERILDERGSGRADAVDLARGALDAWLHPPARSMAPPLLALTGGAVWLVAAGVVLAQPVPPDWPGYLIDMVPAAALGVACLLGAVIGAWLRLGDGVTTVDRLAIDVAVAGHLAWALSLLATAVGLDNGLVTVTAANAAALGTGLVGAALLGNRERAVGAVLVGGAIALASVPGAVAWLALGVAWSAAGFLLLHQVARQAAAH